MRLGYFQRKPLSHLGRVGSHERDTPDTRGAQRGLDTLPGGGRMNDYPPLGFENHVPNIPLAIICLIGAVVYIAIIAGVVIGAIWGLVELLRWVNPFS